MSENVATGLFNLFKRSKVYELVGPDGEKIPVAIQALDYMQNDQLLKGLDRVRESARKNVEATDYRGLLTDRVQTLPSEEIVAGILSMERPAADENADLAPGGETPEGQETAVTKWEKTRRAELDGMEAEALRALLVDRQMLLFTQGRVLQEFIDTSLVLMVVDPATLTPLLSNDVSSPKYIGRLMPETRNQLIEFRREFLEPATEKKTRQVAASADFLPSGESPAEPVDSPGATTATQSISPASSLDSTPSDSG